MMVDEIEYFHGRRGTAYLQVSVSNVCDVFLGYHSLGQAVHTGPDTLPDGSATSH